MTDKSAAAIREFAEKWCLKVIEVMKGDDYIMHDLDGCLSDLTALISEHYYPKEKYDELLQQRDELREALAEQKRLYFSLFDEETSCMYCEAKIRRGSAIILCKECAENTEV